MEITKTIFKKVTVTFKVTVTWVYTGLYAVIFAL